MNLIISIYRLNFLDAKDKLSIPHISCMTGGTEEAKKINEQLAIAASKLNIPIGVGSQRQALEGNEFHSTFDVIKQKCRKCSRTFKHRCGTSCAN
ncbi:MAG: hypothetical protein U5K00_02700 [Melioribacteraceae bacterium]|nr:hypothetical protein [Melioribacteraceae bacterium]